MYSLLSKVALICTGSPQCHLSVPIWVLLMHYFIFNCEHVCMYLWVRVCAVCYCSLNFFSPVIVCSIRMNADETFSIDCFGFGVFVDALCSTFIFSYRLVIKTQWMEHNFSNGLMVVVFICTTIHSQLQRLHLHTHTLTYKWLWLCEKLSLRTFCVILYYVLCLYKFRSIFFLCWLATLLMPL